MEVMVGGRRNEADGATFARIFITEAKYKINKLD